MKGNLIVLFALCLHLSGIAQNYHAINGSPYVTSLGVSNNPASILTTPFTWDMAIFGTQFKTATNAFTINNFSYFSSAGDNTETVMKEGNFKRNARLNFNTNLLNTRIALNRQQAIAFGINLKEYAYAKTSAFNFIDTLHDLRDFLTINQNTRLFTGNITSSGWLEFYGSYAQTIRDDERGRLNVGGTVKIMKGLSGIFARVENVTTIPSAQIGSSAYELVNATAVYGYSSNYDGWINENEDQGLGDFISRSRTSFAFDIGAEYLIKTGAVNSFYDDDDGYYEYDWKIGVSILDIGWNKYTYGTRSRRATGPNANIADSTLDQKFERVSSFDAFNDSLASISTVFTPLSGSFNITNPTRLVINIDRYLFNDFYINGELSLNLSPVVGEQRIYTKEMNLLTVTPRWETKQLGAYMPVQLNNAGKFWIGAAIKAGPLLVGFHNLGNIFLKNTVQNGGGYLAFIIHPGGSTKSKRYNKVDCP